jgi:hypothetical protein
MAAMSKRPLITESVAVIRIGVHSAGEEPDQHIVCVVSKWFATLPPELLQE